MTAKVMQCKYPKAFVTEKEEKEGGEKIDDWRGEWCITGAC